MSGVYSQTTVLAAPSIDAALMGGCLVPLLLYWLTLAYVIRRFDTPPEIDFAMLKAAAAPPSGNAPEDAERAIPLLRDKPAVEDAASSRDRTEPAEGGGEAGSPIRLRSLCNPQTRLPPLPSHHAAWDVPMRNPFDIIADSSARTEES